MRVYQRGSVWYIDYSFNGRRVRKKVGTSKKMAELALKEIELKIAKGVFLGIDAPKEVFFDKLSEEYLLFSKTNKTSQSYRRDITSIKNLQPVFSGKSISRITARDVENYKSMRRDEVKPATVNRELSCLKHMFAKAVQWGFLTHDPLRSVKKFKEPPGRVRYLSDEEMEKLLFCCPEHLKPIVITALNTGMRKGEVLSLKWSDVDMVKRIITIRNSKNHQARHIPINDVLYAELLKLPHKRTKDENVFLGKCGEPIRNIQTAWDKAIRDAGILDFRFHDLRHTFASYLAMQGVSIRILQELLGHKTITMTVRYSHLSNRILRQAVDKLSVLNYTRTTLGTNLAQTDIAKQ